MNREEMSALADELDRRATYVIGTFHESAACMQSAATALRTFATPNTIECPNCHDANKYGDYEGPTCEVCMGEGCIAALSPDSRKAEPVAWQWRHSDAHVGAPWAKWGFVDEPIEAFRVRWANQMRGDPTKAVVEIRPLYAALAPATEDKELGKKVGEYLGMSGIDAEDVAYLRKLLSLSPSVENK